MHSNVGKNATGKNATGKNATGKNATGKNATDKWKQEANMASKRSPGFRGINQVRDDVLSKLVEDN